MNKNFTNQKAIDLLKKETVKMNDFFAEMDAKIAIRQIESNLYEKLISLKVGSVEYKETRANWLTAHYAVQYYANK
jgi:hypothetical protein